MRNFATIAALTLLTVVMPSWGCGEEEEATAEREVPGVLKTRFHTEMKAILRDIQLAQETARAADGSYVDWGELRRSYLSRHIPANYEITLEDQTATRYGVEITHTPSGLSCRMDVSDSAVRGSPSCE